MNPSIDFADQELLRKLFPSLDSGDLPNLNPNEAASVLDFIEKEPDVSPQACASENIMAYAMDGFEDDQNEYPTLSQPGYKVEAYGTVPAVSEIVGLTNVVTNENVRVDEEDEEYLEKTIEEMIQDRIHKKIRRSNKSSRLPVSFEFIATLAVQNGAETVQQVYDFVSTHVPVFEKEARCQRSWKSSIREKLSHSTFFTKEFISDANGKKFYRYTMTSAQVKVFRRKYPFSYGCPPTWLRNPAYYEAIYFGGNGDPSLEGLERTDLYNSAEKKYNFHNKLFDAPPILYPASSNREGSNSQVSNTIHRPQEEEKHKDKVMAILGKKDTDVMRWYTGSTQVQAVVSKPKMKEPSGTFHMTQWEQFQLHKVPMTTSRPFVNNGCFLTPDASPPYTRNNGEFEETGLHDTASSSSASSVCSSSVSSEQMSYKGGNLDCHSPLQLFTTDDINMETPCLTPPNSVQYSLKSSWGSSADETYPTEDRSPAITSSQMSDGSGFSTDDASVETTNLAPLEDKGREDSFVVPPLLNKKMVYRKIERRPDGKTVIRTIYQIVPAVVEAVSDSSEKTETNVPVPQKRDFKKRTSDEDLFSFDAKRLRAMEDLCKMEASLAHQTKKTRPRILQKSRTKSQVKAHSVQSESTTDVDWNGDVASAFLWST